MNGSVDITVDPADTSEHTLTVMSPERFNFTRNMRIKLSTLGGAGHEAVTSYEFSQVHSVIAQFKFTGSVRLVMDGAQDSVNNPATLNALFLD